MWLFLHWFNRLVEISFFTLFSLSLDTLGWVKVTRTERLVCLVKTCWRGSNERNTVTVIRTFLCLPLLLLPPSLPSLAIPVPDSASPSYYGYSSRNSGKLVLICVLGLSSDKLCLDHRHWEAYSRLVAVARTEREDRKQSLNSYPFISLRLLTPDDYLYFPFLGISGLLFFPSQTLVLWNVSLFWLTVESILVG